MLMSKGVVLEKSNKREKALGMYQLAFSKVKDDSLATRLIKGKIEQLALHWMVDAEKLLNQSKILLLAGEHLMII